MKSKKTITVLFIILILNCNGCIEKRKGTLSKIEYEELDKLMEQPK